MASLFITHNLYSQQNLNQKQPAALLPLDPAVKTGKLANGFTYFIRHNATPEKRVVFYIVNKVGSVLENDDQRGLAHFLEHMNFNGTTHYPKNELISYLEKSGVTFGADLNAYTNFDETVYQLPLPSDNPGLLKNGLQIMRDWAHGALLQPEEIDQERGVILEEKRMRSGFDQRMTDKSLPLTLNNSIYSKRMPIGTEKVLTTFKPAEIKSFYDQWYRPDLQALIVVGDVDAGQMEKSVRQLFSDLKNPVNEHIRPRFSIPLTGKKQYLKFTDAEAPNAQILFSYKFMSPQLRTTSEYRAKMVSGLLNQLLASRFNELAQQANVPYIRAGAGSGNYLSNLDVFNFSVTLKPGASESGFKRAFTELERIRQYGFTPAELGRVKESYLSGMKSLLQEKNKSNSANFVEEYVNYFLKQEAAPGIDAEYRMVNEYLPGISPAEINSQIKTYLALPDQDMIVSGPEKSSAELPDAVTLNAWMDEVKKEKIAPYVEPVSGSALMVNEPQPGSITGKSAISSVGATTYKLSNGVHVILKQTNFKNDVVLFYSYKSGGTSLASDQDYQSAADAAALAKAAGVSNFTANQLSKLLSGKKVSVSPYINELYEGFSGSFGAEDMKTALQLVYLYHTAPAKDTVVFKNILSNVKVAVTNRYNDPDAVFTDSVNAILGNHSKRKRSPTLEDIASLDQDKSLAFYKQRFKNANGETFVFVGNFDQAKLLRDCEIYLGSLPADTGISDHFKDLKIKIPPGKATHIIAKGKEVKSEVQLVFSGDYDYSLPNNLQLQALGAIIEFRLLERLRETESGVYTPSAGSIFGKYPSSRYRVDVSFTCAPQNADKLIKASLEEIENLKTKGILATDLEKFKAETLRKIEVRVKTDDYWLSYLVRQFSNHEDPDEVNRLVALVNSLDCDTLQKAAKQYLSGENLQRFILNPEQL